MKCEGREESGSGREEVLKGRNTGRSKKKKIENGNGGLIKKWSVKLKR